MKPFRYLLGGGLIIVSAYAGDASTPARLQDQMKNVIAVQSQVIWDIGGRAQDDDGNPDASKLKAADWNQIVVASNKVKRTAQSLVHADHIVVAGPGKKLQDEENPGAASAGVVQKAIDANPKVFMAFAQQLATAMDGIAAAAQSKNAASFAERSGELDKVCEGCHLQFWYPQQIKKP